MSDVFDKLREETVATIRFEEWVKLTGTEITELTNEYHVIGSHQDHILWDQMILIPKNRSYYGVE
jgi:hypothetical protein